MAKEYVSSLPPDFAANLSDEQRSVINDAVLDYIALEKAYKTLEGLDRKYVGTPHRINEDLMRLGVFVNELRAYIKALIGSTVCEGVKNE